MTEILSSLSIYRPTYLFGPTALPIVPATGLQSDSPFSSRSHTVRTAIMTPSASHQHIKVMWYKPHGELQSLPLPKGVFMEITMDFIMDLLLYTQHGCTYDSILIVVDQYTKLACYYQT